MTIICTENFRAIYQRRLQAKEEEQGQLFRGDKIRLYQELEADYENLHGKRYKPDYAQFRQHLHYHNVQKPIRQMKNPPLRKRKTEIIHT